MRSIANMWGWKTWRAPGEALVETGAEEGKRDGSAGSEVGLARGGGARGTQKERATSADGCQSHRSSTVVLEPPTGALPRASMSTHSTADFAAPAPGWVPGVEASGKSRSAELARGRRGAGPGEEAAAAGAVAAGAAGAGAPPLAGAAPRGRSAELPMAGSAGARKCAAVGLGGGGEAAAPRPGEPAAAAPRPGEPAAAGPAGRIETTEELMAAVAARGVVDLGGGTVRLGDAALSFRGVGDRVELRNGTLVAGPGAASGGYALRVRGAELVCRDLVLRGTGLYVSRGGRAELSGACRVVDPPASGVCVGGGARVTLCGAEVAGAGSNGVEVSGGAVRMEGVRVSGCRGACLNASGPEAEAEVAGGALAGCVEGHGVVCQGGARVSLGGGVDVSGNAKSGALVTGAGSRLRAAGCAFRGSRTGHGVSVQGGARAALEGCAVSQCAQAGVFVSRAGSAAALSGGSIEGTLMGVACQAGGRAELHGVEVRGAGQAGLALGGAGTCVSAEATRVACPGGPGALCEGGARLELRACRVAGSGGAGVVVAGDGSVLEAERLAVAGARGPGGHGVECRGGAMALVKEPAVEECEGCGFLLRGEGTAAEIEGGTVARCGGAGVSCVGGASGVVSHVDVSGCRSSGVLVDGAGSRAQVEGGSVVGCRESGGVVAQRSAKATVRGLEVRSCATFALFADSGGEIAHSDVFASRCLAGGAFGC